MQAVRPWKVTVAVVAFIVLLLVGSWAAQVNHWFMFKVFAPKHEQVRRETFKQSRAFNQGLNQEVQAMRFEYEQASSEYRDALRSIILHRTAGDEEHLSPDLRQWVAELKGGEHEIR